MTVRSTGDIVAIADASDTVVLRYSYDAWGHPTHGDPAAAYAVLDKANPFRYRGYVWDGEMSCFYLLNRYYSEELIRFYNMDDRIHQNVNTSCMSLYNYAYCNPYKYQDSSGQVPSLIENKEMQDYSNIVDVTAVHFMETVDMGYGYTKYIEYTILFVPSAELESFAYETSKQKVSGLKILDDAVQEGAGHLIDNIEYLSGFSSVLSAITTPMEFLSGLQKWNLQNQYVSATDEAKARKTGVAFVHMRVTIGGGRTIIPVETSFIREWTYYLGKLMYKLEE